MWHENAKPLYSGTQGQIYAPTHPSAKHPGTIRLNIATIDPLFHTLRMDKPKYKQTPLPCCTKPLMYLARSGIIDPGRVSRVSRVS